MDGFGQLFVAFALSPAQIVLYSTSPLLIIGIVGVMRVGGVPSQLLPACSLAFGLALSLLIVMALPVPPINYAAGVIMGLVSGVVASGLWSQGKALVGK